MANVLNGNTFYIDTTSAAGTTTSYVDSKDILVESYIVSATSNGSIILYDLKKENGAFVAGDIKMKLSATAYSTNAFFMDGCPVKFPNGIWADTDAGVVATLVIKYKG